MAFLTEWKLTANPGVVRDADAAFPVVRLHRDFPGAARPVSETETRVLYRRRGCACVT